MSCPPYRANPQPEAVDKAWFAFLKKLSPRGDAMEGTRGLRRDATGAMMCVHA